MEAFILVRVQVSQQRMRAGNRALELCIEGSIPSPQANRTNIMDKDTLRVGNEVVSAVLATYSPESLPTDEQATHIIQLFADNYPEMYSDTQRKDDLVRYNSPEQIRNQIKVNNIYTVAELNGAPVAFSKFRLENRSNTPNTEEWLCSWLIVDKPYRRPGIGEKLLETELAKLGVRKQSGKQLFVIADIHRDNTASRELFSKAGFVEEVGKSDDFILAKKEL